MAYLKRGDLFGTEIGTVQAEQSYFVRLEDTPVAQALVHSLGLAATAISPNEDSGRAWLQVPYTAELDLAIKDAIDLLSDLLYSRPNFGQLVLFHLPDAGDRDG